MDEIDSIFNLYLEKLEKYKISHPNIYKLWSNYFKLKSEKIKKNFINFDKMINNIDNNNILDFSDDNIYFIYMFMKTSNI